ncbi:hypothetical protein MBLNU230_g1734t2 [Neophaeotheca triangularis]
MADDAPAGKSYFEQQRELLVGDVAAVSCPSKKGIAIGANGSQSLENVLQNINKLNRSLEGVIAVGNEFSQVEGLWSQFEGVMAKAPEEPKDGSKDTKAGGQEGNGR